VKSVPGASEHNTEIFSIAFICTGNRFRSPLAEAFVRKLTTDLPVGVQSFGTLAVGAVPPLPEAFKLAELSAVDLSGHRARPVGTESLAKTDLVIGFDLEHMRGAVIEAHASRDRAFTFREIVALLEDAPAPEAGDAVRRARQAVEQAARDRNANQRTDNAIRDPYGRSWRVYYETAAEIRELSLGLVGSLFGVTERTALPSLAPQPAQWWSPWKL
jgi:protein-tyrosine phosphatase